MVNPTMMNPVAFNPNMKDSRWLTLEVCREYVRQKCSRTENECKFAHPPAHVEVQNGRVTCCFDSIKGKCQRKDPPCKYLHPPQHLKEQLLQNGRNNLILKNLQMQALAANMPPMVPGIYGPTVAAHHPYVLQNPGFNPYINAPLGMHGVVPGVDTGAATSVPVSSQGSTVGGIMASPSIHKMQRADRLETTPNGNAELNNWATGSHVADTTAPGAIPTSQYSPIYFQNMNTIPGMVPMVKRPAMTDNKSGVPMYAPSTGTSAYQQAALAMQLQQPFVPVTIAGHPPSMPRF